MDISENYNLQIGDENDSNDSISLDENENKNKNKEEINDNNKIINNDNDNKEYNNLIQIKEKNIKEYTSPFDEDNYINNNINNTFVSTPNLKYETMIDDYLFDQNIEFLHNCFPSYEKEKIVQKICDLNFDINAVVTNILDEIYACVKMRN